MLESDQHVRVFQNHLTPNLPKFLKMAEGALNNFLQRDPRLPRTESEFLSSISFSGPRTRSDLPAEWKEVNIHDVLERLVSEMITRIWLGEAFTTNEDWIKLCCEYPRNMFGTAMLLRFLPSPLKYLVSQMIPAKFSIKMQVKEARKVLIPIIETIKKEGKIKSKVKSEAKPNEHAQIGTDDPSVSTLLEWMVLNSSSEAEADPKKLAPRQLILTLAAIHTSVMTVFFALFDLLKYPEYIEPLRDEILALIKNDGDDGIQNLSKHDLNLLEKMDSFLAESLRFHPTIMGMSAVSSYLSLAPFSNNTQPLTRKTESTQSPRSAEYSKPSPSRTAPSCPKVFVSAFPPRPSTSTLR